jgi:hypothetical protein
VPPTSTPIIQAMHFTPLRMILPVAAPQINRWGVAV